MSKPYLAKVENVPQGYGPYPFRNGDTVIVLGEVEQMPEHMVIAGRDGKVHFGWDVTYFRKLTEDEA